MASEMVAFRAICLLDSPSATNLAISASRRVSSSSRAKARDSVGWRRDLGEGHRADLTSTSCFIAACARRGRQGFERRVGNLAATITAAHRPGSSPSPN